MLLEAFWGMMRDCLVMHPVFVSHCAPRTVKKVALHESESFLCALLCSVRLLREGGGKSMLGGNHPASEIGF